MRQKQFEQHLETLSNTDLLKIAKAAEAKYRRAIARGEAQINPKLVRDMRAEIERVERGQ